MTERLIRKPYSHPDFSDTIDRVEYTSSADGRKDWALVRLGQKSGTWVVCIHGHGSHGDQLYTREDIRERWLGEFIKVGGGILTPNLRDNAWMSPAAAKDMNDLLQFIRDEYDAQKFIFASGSMGGTSNLIYGILHPEDVAGIIALGATSDLAGYYRWCRVQQGKPIAAEIADAIESAYGGSPEKQPKVYRRHNVIEHCENLTMPVYLAHGEHDAAMPVDQSRRLAQVMAGKTNFTYDEIPAGKHDSPLSLLKPAIDWIMNHASLSTNCCS